MLSKKIDFAVIIRVKNANPNGDPLNGNRPRTTYDGLGEISDVCLKRKLRNRLLDCGESILVQSDDHRSDEHRSIKARFEAEKSLTALHKNQDDEARKIACQKWFDVRAFGQVFAFKGNQDDNTKGKTKKEKTKDNTTDNTEGTGVSIGIRGPVTIQSAFSVETVDVTSLQITKSVNLETNKDDPARKASDTMGMKHRVDKGVYVSYGSINKQLAEITGFSDDDAEKIKSALLSLFENDESSARPAGSMEVLKVIWWTHDAMPSAKVHRSLCVNADGSYELDVIEGVNIEELSY